MTHQDASFRATGADGPAALKPLNERAFSVIESYQNSPLLAQGRINLISLDAIAERMGDRWASRRDPIYTHVERTIARHVGEAGDVHRISDTGYLIVQPEVSRYAGQANCLRGLREVLTYFLGAAQPIDLQVRQVSAIAPEGVSAALVDAAAVMAASEREVADAETVQSGATGDQWSPFLASSGQRVRVSCTLEPVLELKGYARIGYRVARRVLCLGTDAPLSTDERSRMSRADLEKIDFATIARGLDRLKSEAGEEKQPSLILPVSYISLSNQRTRSVLIGLFQQAQQTVKRGLICEICDIDGAPQAGLVAAISFIKPHCLFVVGRTNAARDIDIRNLRGAGLQAITVEAGDRFETDGDYWRWLKGVIAAAKTVTKSVMVYDLTSAHRAALAGTLGATHASIRLATAL